MKTTTALLLASTASLGLAADANCTDYDIAVPVSTQGFTFNLEPFANSSALVQFIIDTTSRTADLSSDFGPRRLVNGTYHIAAHYCTPNSGSGNGIIQVLTHGIGFDKSYWDFGDEDTNYITAATAAGYSTFSYDRLGVGNSGKPDPYFDVQAEVELAILVEITNALKGGKLTEAIATPSKIVHVGHSFGSILSNGLAAAYPNLSDGIILTGFSLSTDYIRDWLLAVGFRLAKEVEPDKWGDRSSGYLIWADKYQNQAAFLKYPYFSPENAEASEESKQPASVGELLTIVQLNLDAADFKGPVQIITGDSDVPACGADCYGIVDNRSLAEAVFPQASVIDLYVHPHTGHGINAHYNASGAYNVITNFLKSNGL